VTDAVETRALRKRYGSHVALDGVDLSVPSGTIYGFLGPNGSGKTTTMRILLGLLRADAGSARVLGADAWTDGPRLRADVGYLPSAPGLHGRMRGAHALEHFSRLDRRPPVLRAAACRALRLSDADLARPIRAYSRGMRQKLAIVGAVQHDPRLLVLDEPTEGLDPLVQDGFLELCATGAAQAARSSCRRTSSRRSRPCATAWPSCARVGSSARAPSRSSAADGRVASR
jgi:ABC-2 type transport system ATP-binding protein